MFAEYTAREQSQYYETNLIITAILHDTIEDTSLIFDMIQSIFCREIANQVMDLTRIKEDGRKMSGSQVIETLIKEKKYDILLIKQFDRLHNLKTIGVKSPDKAKKIISETLVSFVTAAI